MLRESGGRSRLRSGPRDGADAAGGRDAEIGLLLDRLGGRQRGSWPSRPAQSARPASASRGMVQTVCERLRGTPHTRIDGSVLAVPAAQPLMHIVIELLQGALWIRARGRAPRSRSRGSSAPWPRAGSPAGGGRAAAGLAPGPADPRGLVRAPTAGAAAAEGADDRDRARTRAARGPPAAPAAPGAGRGPALGGRVLARAAPPCWPIRWRRCCDRVLLTARPDFRPAVGCPLAHVPSHTLSRVAPTPERGDGPPRHGATSPCRRKSPSTLSPVRTASRCMWRRSRRWCWSPACSAIAPRRLWS